MWVWMKECMDDLLLPAVFRVISDAYDLEKLGMFNHLPFLPFMKTYFDLLYGVFIEKELWLQEILQIPFICVLLAAQNFKCSENKEY